MNSEASSPPSPEALEFPGPAGPLAGILERAPKHAQPPVRGAVLCHPHPLYGGSMDDAVLKTVARALGTAGFDRLRFNFRGAGQGTSRSAGDHDGRGAEAQDVAAALDALSRLQESEATGGSAPLLVGYSFGAAMAWAAAQSPGSQALAGLWLIAPPVSVMDLIPEPAAAPLTLFWGTEDQFLQREAIERFQEAAGAKGQAVRSVVLPGSDHFFSGQLEALEAAATQALR